MFFGAKINKISDIWAINRLTGKHKFFVADYLSGSNPSSIDSDKTKGDMTYAYLLLFWSDWVIEGIKA